MLNNDIIRLRPLEEEDSELLRNWRFSPENYNYFYEFVPVNKEENKKWVQNTLNKKSEYNFIIQTIDKKDIGTISLIDIDLRNKKCELGRVLIADENSHGKNYGTQAINILLNYAFNHLNMNKVYCEVFADNEKALNVYKKCGFKQDGLFEKHIFKNGEYKDIIHMAKIKEA